MDPLQELEFLSLVNSVTRDLANFLGEEMADKTLAEFIVSMHEESKTPGEFSAKLKEIGGEQFSDNLISNLDRLITNMHPKYKKNRKAGGAQGMNGNSKTNGAQKDNFISGLSLPDGQKWKSVEDLVAEEQREKKAKGPMAGQVDDLMSQLDSIGEKRRSEASSSRGYDDDRDRGRDAKRSRRQVSVSPPRMGNGRPKLDDRPVLYKIYEGTVGSMRDFGAFVQLQGLSSRTEGKHQHASRVMCSYNLIRCCLQGWFIFHKYSKAFVSITRPMSFRKASE